jgi:hypothetical protein
LELKEQVLNAHLAEYSNSLSYVNARLQAGRVGKASPKGFCKAVVECYEFAMEIEDGNLRKAHFLKKLGSRPRAIHDYFGWKSKKQTIEDPLSVCKGAIYRTIGYMNINLADRSGARSDKFKPFGVHIEHTIPVHQISQHLWESAESLKGLDGMYCLDKIQALFFDISICTAMSRVEERQGILKGHSKNHPQMQDGCLKSIVSVNLLYPFARYSDDVEVFEMISGSQIDMKTWTISDHRNLLQKAKIYY